MVSLDKEDGARILEEEEEQQEEEQQEEYSSIRGCDSISIMDKVNVPSRFTTNI